MDLNFFTWTLEEVVEFYNSGDPARSAILRGSTPPSGLPRPEDLTGEQKAALVAFLKALTDTPAGADRKFSESINNWD